MDIVRNIFKTPSSLPKENPFNSESPLGALEEHIKQLENINLSPLPSTKEAVMIHKNDVSGILKKIIYNFDIILMDKMRKIRIDLSKNINLSEDNHYWNFLSKFFQIPSVKFINNIYDKLQTNSEKGLAWIYISISEKSFFESVKEIYLQGFDKKFYEPESLIIKNKLEILFFSEKICKFHLFNIKLGIEDEYNDYKRQKEIEGKEVERSDIDLPCISPINNDNNRKKSFNPYITPYTLDLKDGKNLKENFYSSKATFDFNFSNLHSKADAYNPDKSTKTIDNLFNIINNEDEENNFTIENNDEDDVEIIREKSHAKNTQIIYSNVTRDNVNHSYNYNNYNGEEKILGALKIMAAKTPNNTENYNVCKYFDMQSCFKEDFYHSIFEGRTNSNEERGIMKNKSPIGSNLKKGVLVLPASNISKKETEMSLENILKKSHMSIQLTNHTNDHIPFDKNFRVCRKVDKNQYSKKDIIYYNNKELKMTNSIVFYLNHFYKKVPYIKFNTHISTEKPITLASQNFQCQFCLKKFSTFLHLPLSKVFWCSYYMRFICQDCVSDEFSIVPAFILKYWNFKKFLISNSAKELLTLWYDKPVIHIKQNDHIIKESSLLHSAIVLKRKIHKIFDLMKCENSESYVFNTLKEYKYLVLRETLFSLKDLVDIYEFRLIKKLKDFLLKFEEHILKECADCSYKGGKCMMCMTDEILFAYDVETVLHCNECKKLFHKKCCSFHPCIINR